MSFRTSHTDCHSSLSARGLQARAPRVRKLICCAEVYDSAAYLPWNDEADSPPGVRRPRLADLMNAPVQPGLGQATSPPDFTFQTADARLRAGPDQQSESNLHGGSLCGCATVIHGLAHQAIVDIDPHLAFSLGYENISYTVVPQDRRRANGSNPRSTILLRSP